MHLHRVDFRYAAKISATAKCEDSCKQLTSCSTRNLKFTEKHCRIVQYISDGPWSPHDKYYPPSVALVTRSYLTALRVICIFQPEASSRSLLLAIRSARRVATARFRFTFQYRNGASYTPRWLNAALSTATGVNNVRSIFIVCRFAIF